MSSLDIPNACQTSANEPVGTTSLEAASCNLSKLDMVVNNPPGSGDIPSRTGEALIALADLKTGGVIVFATFALLDAYEPAVFERRTSFKVTNDTDSSLNGFYSWVSGTTYTKDADLANGVVENGNPDAVSGGTVFNSIRDQPLNFMSFVTSEVDRSKIVGPSQTTNQDSAAMKTYFDNFFSYIVANDIKKAVIPDGVYRPDSVTISGIRSLDLICYGAEFFWRSGDSTFKADNCKRLKFHGGHFTGIGITEYSDTAWVRVVGQSSYTEFFFTQFSEFPRSGILAEDLGGGVAQEGVDIINCLFTNADNYDNALQTAITLGSNGEYSRVLGCSFKNVPTAARFVNGANGMFKDNIVAGTSMNDDSRLLDRAAIYCDIGGDNDGKIDIVGNKINHNAKNLTSVIIKGEGQIIRASRVLDNDFLVNGGDTNYTAVYLDNSPGTVIKNTKIMGTILGGSELSASIVINNSRNTVIEDTTSVRFDVGISLENGSTDVYVGRQITESVNTELVVDGTSSLLPS